MSGTGRRVVLVFDGPVTRTPDGAVSTLGLSLRFVEQLFETFERVAIICRLQRLPAPQPGSIVLPAAAELIVVPTYGSLLGFARIAPNIRRIVREHLEVDDAIILRLASHLSLWIGRMLRAGRRRYGVHVLNDPSELFTPGAIEHPLRPLLRWWFVRETRRACAAAEAALYVTERTLQARYPCDRAMFGASDVALPLAKPPGRQPRQRGLDEAIRIVTVGSLEQPYKGVDDLLRALSSMRRTSGLDLRLTVLGDGRQRARLEAFARSLALADVVAFRGQVSTAEVHRALEDADVFVLASRTEGLPRALVEAMYFGVPCIATCVGGTPELLAARYLVPPNAPEILAERLLSLLRSPGALEETSRANLETVRRFESPRLEGTVTRFLQHLARQAAVPCVD
ncbi:MAG TPA: glycosyltransferase [Planctomycetota bacterium]|nr:glycosyltransferase [Planctomycetota bacterium]